MFPDNLCDGLDTILRYIDRVVVIISSSYLDDGWLRMELDTFYSKQLAHKIAPLVPVLWDVKATDKRLRPWISDQSPVEYNQQGNEIDFAKLVNRLYSQQQVFVSMRIGDATLDAVYGSSIKPVVEELKYSVLRADEPQNSNQLNEEILRGIAASDIVIADVSGYSNGSGKARLEGGSPNVYHEVGYAQGLQKEIILTARVGTHIHFNLSGYRVIIWKDAEDLGAKLKERFAAIRRRHENQARRAEGNGMPQFDQTLGDGED